MLSSCRTGQGLPGFFFSRKIFKKWRLPPFLLSPFSHPPPSLPPPLTHLPFSFPLLFPSPSPSCFLFFLLSETKQQQQPQKTFPDRRLKQEDCGFRATLNKDTASSHLKKQNKAGDYLLDLVSPLQYLRVWACHSISPGLRFYPVKCLKCLLASLST